jgi:DNA polymerase-3 subunit delta
MLLFFFGSDQYRLQQESLSERERFFGKDTPQNVIKFDASERGEFSWKAFAESVRDGGLFSEKRCVILENISSLSEDEKGKFKKWLDSKDSPKDNAEVLCIACDTKPDKRTAFFKALQKNVAWREFSLMAPDEFLRYARALAKDKFPEITFERGVLESVARGCGSDLFRLTNELKKLSAYAGNEKKITQESVNLLCSSGVFDEIFGALEAIGRGDKKTALILLSRQIKKGEHPIYLLTMCAYQIRTMLLVGECLEKGISQPALIAREAKIHPFVAGKTIGAMQTFGMARARKAFALLGRLDTAIKTGKIDAGLAVEEFVLRS